MVNAIMDVGPGPVQARECNPDLLKERRLCSFDVTELTNIIDGSKDKTEDRHRTEEQLFSIAGLIDNVRSEYLSHEDRYSLVLKRSCSAIRHCQELGLFENEASMRNMFGVGLGSAVTPDGSPLTLHFIMFLPTLLGQGSPEQHEKWFMKAWNCEIIGTYAQTELGHGTFVRGLETTATYDPASEEFVIHSPTLTALKWWPGGLGKTVNYAVVLAQLHTNGKCYGIHPFIVQLRDEATHVPLPGIEVGEIGAKLGYHDNDNGFLRFTNVRIPRTHMLMKNAQVLPDGTYVRPASEKLGYGTMVFVRVILCFEASKELMKACTIATRYSAVRRQSEMKPGEPEPQILDYQMQQLKLFPNIAACFAFHFAGSYLWNLYHNVSSNMEDGYMQELPELHALTCGLKAMSTAEAAAGIETCRMACGGHGYMTCSNLPRLYGKATAACTFEGENTVLWLQVARYLVKSYRQAVEGAQLQKFAAYLQNVSAKSSWDSIGLEDIIQAFQQVSTALVRRASDELHHKISVDGVAPEIAWNLTSVNLVESAQAHCRSFIVERFADAVQELDCSPETREILLQLSELYAIYWLLHRSGDFLRYGGMTSKDLDQLQNRLEELLLLLRPNAVGIVDAFDFRDELLGSALGAWDGKVYERLYESAKKSALNATDVPTGIKEYLHPFMKSSL